MTGSVRYLWLILLLLGGCSGGAATAPPLSPVREETAMASPRLSISPTVTAYATVGAATEGGIPEGAIYHRIGEANAAATIPAGLSWQLSTVERNGYGLFIHESSSSFAVASREEPVWVQRLRVEPLGEDAPIIILDYLTPTPYGVPSYLSASYGPAQSGGETPQVASLDFTIASHADGCDLYGRRSGLYRVSLTSGEMVELIPADQPANVIGPSPDGEKVAYVQDAGTPILVIRTLATGAEQWIALDGGQGYQSNEQSGGFTWSPASDAVAYTTVRGACNSAPLVTTISVATLADGAATTLTSVQGRFLDIVGWTGEARLHLADRGSYWLDTETGELRDTPE